MFKLNLLCNLFVNRFNSCENAGGIEHDRGIVFVRLYFLRFWHRRERSREKSEEDPIGRSENFAPTHELERMGRGNTKGVGNFAYPLELMSVALESKPQGKLHQTWFVERVGVHTEYRCAIQTIVACIRTLQASDVEARRVGHVECFPSEG